MLDKYTRLHVTCSTVSLLTWFDAFVQKMKKDEARLYCKYIYNVCQVIPVEKCHYFVYICNMQRWEARK
jgi:hypothetical protein